MERCWNRGSELILRRDGLLPSHEKGWLLGSGRVPNRTSQPQLSAWTILQMYAWTSYFHGLPQWLFLQNPLDKSPPPRPLTGIPSCCTVYRPFLCLVCNQVELCRSEGRIKDNLYMKQGSKSDQRRLWRSGCRRGEGGAMALSVVN